MIIRVQKVRSTYMVEVIFFHVSKIKTPSGAPVIRKDAPGPGGGEEKKTSSSNKQLSKNVLLLTYYLLLECAHSSPSFSPYFTSSMGSGTSW